MVITEVQCHFGAVLGACLASHPGSGVNQLWDPGPQFPHLEHRHAIRISTCKVLRTLLST